MQKALEEAWASQGGEKKEEKTKAPAQKPSFAENPLILYPPPAQTPRKYVEESHVLQDPFGCVKVTKTIDDDVVEEYYQGLKTPGGIAFAHQLMFRGSYLLKKDGERQGTVPYNSIVGGTERECLENAGAGWQQHYKKKRQHLLLVGGGFTELLASSTSLHDHAGEASKEAFITEQEPASSKKSQPNFSRGRNGRGFNIVTSFLQKAEGGNTLRT